MSEVWVHKKRGTMYRVLTTTAHVQCSTSPDFEQRYGDDNWTVYQSVSDGAVYVRLSSEFHDGRFERATTDA